MKLTTYSLNGKEYRLLVNGTALFDFYDRFGKDADMSEMLANDDHKLAFEAAIWMLAEFSLQGELYRRSQGEDRGSIISVRQAELEVLPADIPSLKLALMETIRAGFMREHRSDDGYDPWLAELNQKKTMDYLGPGISAFLRKFLGLAREKE